LILVTVGTQKYAFDRLIKKIDELKKSNIVSDDIFAQIGESQYIPQSIKYERYIKKSELERLIQKSNLIIAHAGVGLIMNALKLDKKIVVVPRLAEYNEHINNHQVQIAEEFEKEGYVIYAREIDRLGEYINKARTFNNKKYLSNSNNFCKVIVDELEKINGDILKHDT
jgi:UDP-N-acetylglucosamine transferase subunit ALG13